MNAQSIKTLSLVILLGIFAVAAFIAAFTVNGRWQEPIVTCTGQVIFDTASQEDLYLHRAHYIIDLNAPRGRNFLKFRDDKTMNEARGKEVKVMGILRPVRLDDGDFVKELEVQEIEYLPSKPN